MSIKKWSACLSFWEWIECIQDFITISPLAYIRRVFAIKPSEKKTHEVKKNQTFAHLGYTSNWCTHINVARTRAPKSYVKHGINGRFITFPKCMMAHQRINAVTENLWKQRNERTTHSQSLLLNENDFVCFVCLLHI